MGAEGAKDMKNRLKNSVTTLVGSDATIAGNLAFGRGCHVAGVVKGDVIALDGRKTGLTVAQGGRVDGNARAGRMLIRGTVVGDLHCTGTVSLASSARVQGSIEYGEIEVEKGAVVTGSLTMRKERAGKPASANSGRAAKLETGDNVQPATG